MTQTLAIHPRGSDLCVAGGTLWEGAALREPRCPLSFQAQVTEGPQVSREWKASRRPSLLCPLPGQPLGSPPFIQFTSSVREHNGHLGCQGGGKVKKAEDVGLGWMSLSQEPHLGVRALLGSSLEPPGADARPRGCGSGLSGRGTGLWRLLAEGDGISQPEVWVAERFPFSWGG